MKTRSLILASLMMTALPVHAGDLNIHLVSEHSGHKPHLNEENYGIGYTGDGDFVREYLPLCGRLQCRGSIGYYTNSWFRDSLYAGIRIPINRHVSVSGLLISGYAGPDIDTTDHLIAGELAPFAAITIDVAPDWNASPVLSIGPTENGLVALLSLRTTLGKNR